jgi:phospholipase/carboxylesterase
MKPLETSLTHRVFMPERPVHGRHPAIIFIHGRGADEEDLLGLSPACDERLLLLSVRAPYPYPPGGGYTWYDADARGTPEPSMFRRSYDMLTGFVEDIRSGYPIDPGRVFLFGFSMGSVMALALSLTRPERYSGVVAHSGYVPEHTNLSFRWKSLAQTSFFLAHGSLDPVIPISLARRAQALFMDSNASLTYREYPMGHQISDESLGDAVRWMAPLLESKGEQTACP